MSSATTLTDGLYLTGTYNVPIDGFVYTLETYDHDLPVSQSDTTTSAGVPKGGAFARGKEKVAVKIKAIAGTPPPSQLVKFPFAFDNLPTKNWVVTNLKASGSNAPASIQEFSADISEFLN